MAYYSEFKNGLAHGCGYFSGVLESWLNGDLEAKLRENLSKDFCMGESIIYSGEWKFGVPNGKGILLKGGKEYRGEWNNGTREGLFLIMDSESKS